MVVANSGYYGKGMHIAPDASVTDGLADVVVIEAASRRSMMRALPKVYDGGHIALEQVTVLRGARVEISGSPSVPMGGDGEPIGALPTSALRAGRHRGPAGGAAGPDVSRFLDHDAALIVMADKMAELKPRLRGMLHLGRCRSWSPPGSC